MKNTAIILVTIIITTFIVGCNQKSEKLTPQEARQIAKEAYIFGFPIVMNYKTLFAYVLDKNSLEYKGEFNQKSCDARLYTPEDKAVVTPNSDTPYCMFWCDISQEPVVITLPDMEPERYYSFQLIDLYTHNFAYIGTLTTGNNAAKYLVATDNWNGKVPDGITNIIRCETDLFLNIVRTQLLSEKDIANVRSIQADYQLQTLSEYMGKESTPSIDHNNFPVWVEGDQFSINAFKYLGHMLQFLNPNDEEKELLERFSRLGIGTKDGFDSTRFNAEALQAIKLGVQDGIADIEGFISENSDDPLISAKIFGTRDFLINSAKQNYNLTKIDLLRAVAADRGLYGNSGKEAIYPTYLFDDHGNPLNASRNNYTLTFENSEFPPVKSFWSITMYDGKTQLLINNPISRYIVNSTMMDDFVMNDDGSLTIYIQKDSPGVDKETNWLPAPDGPFYAVMRLYGPEEEALSGQWINPPIKIIN